MPFGVDDALAIAGLIAALTSAGTGIGKAAKQNKNERKIEKYNEDVEDAEEKQRKEQEREQRRAALARAIGVDVVGLAGDSSKEPIKPKLDSTTGLDIAGGISNVVGTGANQAAGMVDNISDGSKQSNFTNETGTDIFSGTGAATKTSGAGGAVNSMSQSGDFAEQAGDPLAKSSTNRYQRYAQKNYKYA